MEKSILYSKGLSVKISINRCISVAEDCFILANSADPYEMGINEAFHSGLHYLPNYPFMGAQWLIGNDRGAVGSSPTSVTVLCP